MQLLVVRHAIAIEREDFSGKNDADRPLTDEGKNKFKKAAQALPKLVEKIDLILSSPFKRALQTSEILAKPFGEPTLRVCPALTPDQHPNAFLAWANAELDSRTATVAVVGHEPHLSRFISFLLSSAAIPFIEVKKGSITSIRTLSDKSIQAGACILEWSIRQGQLSRLSS